MSHYDAAADSLRLGHVSVDTHAVSSAILALADRVEALTVAVNALTDETRDPVRTASPHTQPDSWPPMVCPGCSTVHRDSGLMCDTCASGSPA